MLILLPFYIDGVVLGGNGEAMGGLDWLGMNSLGAVRTLLRFNSASPRFFWPCDNLNSNTFSNNMAEPDAKAAPAAGTTAGPSKPPRPPNPVWKMMGRYSAAFWHDSRSNFYRPAKLSLQATLP